MLLGRCHCPVNFGLRRVSTSISCALDAAELMSVRVCFGLRRACPQNRAVLVHRLGLAYEPKNHAELVTEIEAHFRNRFALSNSNA